MPWERRGGVMAPGGWPVRFRELKRMRPWEEGAWEETSKIELCTEIYKI